MVVDFCAGAGGKTLLLGALMRSQGRLYAFDVVARSGSRTSRRGSQRSGLSNVHPQVLTQRARHEGEAPRRQDRPRAGRRAVHRLRHAAPQSRPQVAAAGSLGRRTRGQAGVDPRRGGDAGQARRPPRLRDVQRAARRERGDRRRVSRRASRSSRRATPPPSSRAPTSRSTPDRRCSSCRTAHGCDGFFAAVLERIALNRRALRVRVAVC